ncbi:sigma factor G inhibitor Gin [Dehalobacterium formicoaceticum]|uniref:sigma factor G inhibitor Gin n=1 Tax=Dehalobacterium formicoaceticum TaxID=51515 RepID=UPI000B7DC8DB
MMKIRCLVCSEIVPLHARGMIIQGNFICPYCEEMIATLNPEDIYYPYVQNCLKKIWIGRAEIRS